MFNETIDYTVYSTDVNHYNRIKCSLMSPITKYSTMIVTCFTANCDIVVLNKDDYIMINKEKYSLETDYTNLNKETLSGLLNELFGENSDLETVINTKVDEAGRFVFSSHSNFTINDMTYNFKLIMGFYNTTFPITSDFYDEEENEYSIRSNSSGFNLLTPILYLTSNIAMQSYRNINAHEVTGAKIVMRLDNSFSPGYPIVVNNADFETTIPSNDLSALELTLLDANMKEVQLLSPMYLSIHVRALPDEQIPEIFNSPEKETEDKSQK